MSTTSSQIELQRPSFTTTINSTGPIIRSADYEDTRARRLSDDEPVPPPDATSQLPDGGKEAWTMVFASAVFTFWLNGVGNSWGVVQSALLKQGLTSTSTLSFVGSLSITCAVAFSLLSVRFMRLVGAKWAGLIGIVMLGLGELTSGFTTSSVAGLFGTTGMLFGTGSSLCFVGPSVLFPLHLVVDSVRAFRDMKHQAGSPASFPPRTDRRASRQPPTAKSNA
jgi:hypothetical protein